MAGQLILLGTPRELHIPAMAMAFASSREERVIPKGLQEVTKFAGRKCHAWLQARHDGDSIRLIETQNYIPLQTAFYATWLVIRDEATAREFLEAFPNLSLDSRLLALDAKSEQLRADLSSRLIRGDFDLARVGSEDQRENLARRYVETSDKIHQLGADRRLLDIAKKLATEWQEKV